MLDLRIDIGSSLYQAATAGEQGQSFRCCPIFRIFVFEDVSVFHPPAL